MSKQAKLIPKKEKKFYTIEEFFKSVLNNRECRIFHFHYYGNLTAANKKTKKPCRISIALPNDLGDLTNLKTLDNWSFFGIAIPRKIIENMEVDEE